MEVSVSNQLYVFLAMTLAGAAAGALFDIFRIIRRTFRTGPLTTSLSDVLFWLLISAGMFLAMFFVNNAEVRWFEAIGILLGGVVYFLTLSRLFVKVIGAVFRFVIKIILFILKIVLTPLAFLYKMIKRPLVWAFAKVMRFVKKGGKRSAGLASGIAGGFRRLWLVRKKS